MSRTDQLLKKLGGNMADSIGDRPQKTPPSQQIELPAPDKYAGRTRNRAAGEMQLAHIVPDPDQPRKSFHPHSLRRMAESIEKHGVLQPIRVRWRDDLRRWVIISGERRYRASMLAGLSAIPCIFVERESDDRVVRLEQLVENCQREDLLPMEQAEAFRQLTELTGWSTQQLANELNLSKASVVRSLALLPLFQRSLWSHRP